MPYVQPFQTQPWRFLWWLDNAAHESRWSNWFGGRAWYLWLPICNQLDRRLLRSG